MATDIQALADTSDRRQTYFLSKAFYLIFAGSKLTFLAVHAHEVISPYSVYLTESILTFTSSVSYLIKVFLVLALNNKYL
jgi:hypothetical protein